MKVIEGPYSDFMGCSNFPECRYKEKLKLSTRLD
jgi:ssDNA-binding Zn-finger/Zn-ribbon topoisomerase 1